jgi:hypothetical protein
MGKMSEVLKHGPAVTMSHKTHALLMRAFMAVMMLAVVALAVWAYLVS